MHKFTLFSLNIIVISEKKCYLCTRFKDNKYKIKNINTKL